ncbi:MAG TPA: type II CAAX endopeptidase family protein [Candidatus Acidoferrum sp.]|nr:type II CAAX endopeptidase family protein [Candidatus Acidoferrum sp.]
MATIATATPQSSRPELVAPVWHTIGFLLLMFSAALLQALRLVPFRVHTRMQFYVFTIVFEILMVIYVWLFGLRKRRKTLREVIGGKWDSVAAVLLDIGISLLFGIIVLFVLGALRYILGANPAAIRAIKVLSPRSGFELLMWVLLSTTAGFCEELLFRGYLQRQFLATTGRIEIAIPLQALVFGAGHLYEGWKAAVSIVVYGAMFGCLAVLRKSLRPGMLQHAGYDSFVGFGAFLLNKYNRWPPGLL